MQRPRDTAGMAAAHCHLLRPDPIPGPNLDKGAHGQSIGRALRQVDLQPSPGIVADIAIKLHLRAPVDDDQVQPSVAIQIGQRRPPAACHAGHPGLQADLAEYAIRAAHQQVVRVIHGAARHLLDIALGDEQIVPAVIIHIAELRVPTG